jgi:Fur family zinc uptake transcriptional regulator
MAIDAAPPASGGHDHDVCVADALAAAESICHSRGARLTAVRRRVLELVWSGHRPVGAYDVLAALAPEGRPAAPPTVYRALDFLIEQGLIHRIASLNAFVGCAHPEAAHAGQFLICLACREVSEFDDPAIAADVAGRAAARGFAVSAQNLEVTGLCARCRGGEARPAP